MTKEAFVESLEGVFEGCGLELHIVFNNDSVKFARLDDNVAEKLKAQFSAEIRNLFLSDTGYALLPIENADDSRGNTFYYFDNENLFDNLRFLVQFSEQASNDNFSFSDDGLEGITGFILKLSNASKSVFLFKKHYPVNYLKRASILRVYKSNDKFEELEHDILNIDKSFDFLMVDNHVVVSKMKTLERFFGFEDYIKQTAIQNISMIEALDFIDDMTHLRNSIEKTRIAKKLNRAMNVSPVLGMFESEKEAVINFIEEHPKLKSIMKINESRDKIQLTSLKSVEAFVKLLDDDYLKSELTKMLYDSQSKDAMNMEE